MNTQGRPEPLSFAPRPAASTPGEGKPKLKEESQKDEKVFLPMQRRPSKSHEFCLFRSESIHPAARSPQVFLFSFFLPSGSEFKKLHPQRLLKIFFFLGLFVGSRVTRIFSRSPLPETALPRVGGKCSGEGHFPNPTHAHTHTSPSSIKLWASEKAASRAPVRRTEVILHVEPQAVGRPRK